MTGPIDTNAMGALGEVIQRIPGDAAPAQPNTLAVDGPLSQGLAGLHNAKATMGFDFAREADTGIAETGTILRQVGSDFTAIDGKGAVGMRRLLDDPTARTAPREDTGQGAR